MSDDLASIETPARRAHQVASAIDLCRHRLEAGEAISVGVEIAAHPDLMPELAIELQKLLLIWQAKAEAQFCSSTTSYSLVDSATQPHRHSAYSNESSGAASVPTRIGPYEILRVLGEGGYGIVYLGKDIELDRLVAIKVAKEDDDRSSDQVSAFIEEARHVAQLKHPSIVNVLDVFRGDADTLYFVMEYIEGPTLSDVFAEGQLSTVALVELLIQVADAIQYAHSNGILHRDLKPSNVLLDKLQQHLYIVDFGMAVHEREQSRAPRYAMGTPYCMAPEQVRGENHRLDARTDIWSLGVMMYQGLTGRHPFTGEDISGLFHGILENDPERLSHINPCVPAELERICLKCLAKRMGDRYTTSADLSSDLRRWRTDSSEPPAGPPRAIENCKAATEVSGNSQLVPKGLHSFCSEDADFFLDLLPGPRDREGLPESVHSWLRALESRDHRPELAVLVLYGPTGSGKSSFVHAGLLPRVDPSITAVCVDATASDLERNLLTKLHRACSDLPARARLVEACALIRRGGIPHFQGKLVIVLDQFEQWLHANNRCLSGELANALRQCDGERLQCLIIVRSDFWLGITRFMRELEIPLIEEINSGHLDLFDARHARKVMALFGRSYGCLPKVGPLDGEHDRFLDQAVQQISRDGWVMPVRLALFADMIRGQEWNPDTLNKLGGERGVGVAFLNQAFSSSLSAPSHRRYRRAAEVVLRALLPEQGIDIRGRSRTQAELIRACGYENKTESFTELVDILDSQLRLITPIECGEAAMHGADGVGSSAQLSTYRPSYQLTHDYLVPALREWLSREQQSTPAGRARLCLEERDRQWRQARNARYFPSLPELVRIYSLTDRKSWNDSQTSMIRGAFKWHLKRIFVGTLAVAALSILISTLYYSTRPSDPLLTFQNPTLPAAQRMTAFDRLDLSNAAALGPVIYTIKSEHQPEVLHHAIHGMYEYVQKMQFNAEASGDSLRDLILSETGELLGREEIVGGETEDPIRATLFSIYAALAAPPDVLQFAAGEIDRNRSLGKQALERYLDSFDVRHLLENQSKLGPGEAVPAASIKTVTSLVRLMDALPPGDQQSQAAGLLAQLPEDRLATLFMASFVGKPYSYAERSAAIYIRSLPTVGKRRSEARRLLAVLSDKLRIMLNVSEGSELSNEQLSYVLASIQSLQPHAEFWSPEMFGDVRSLLQRREEYRDSDVIDIACATYAKVYEAGIKSNRTKLDDLETLREMLVKQNENIEFRCAAADALGTVDDATVIADLAAIATSAGEPLRLRSKAIAGLGSIGRRRLAQQIESPDIVEVLASLLDASRYHSEGLLAEVVREIAAIGEPGQLKYVISVLPRRDYDLNLHVQDAIFAFLFRKPKLAEQIADQTLVTMVALSEEERQALYPSPEQFLADIIRMRHSCDDQTFCTACRHLTEALATLTAEHTNPMVRRLAHQNLRQLPSIEGLPDIDPDSNEGTRRQQLRQWRERWSELEDRLQFSDDLQFELR